MWRFHNSLRESARTRSTGARLAAFQEVQNTYLSIFQLLGGLGLLLGTVGLGMVVLRNALERRSELAELRTPPAQLAAISKMLEKALAERDAPAAQEATRRLMRANRERLLKAVEEERTATQASTTR